jgi:hypothetical protein
VHLFSARVVERCSLAAHRSIFSVAMAAWGRFSLAALSFFSASHGAVEGTGEVEQYCGVPREHCSITVLHYNTLFFKVICTLTECSGI